MGIPCRLQLERIELRTEAANRRSPKLEALSSSSRTEQKRYDTSCLLFLILYLQKESLFFGIKVISDGVPQPSHDLVSRMKSAEILNVFPKKQALNNSSKRHFPSHFRSSTSSSTLSPEINFWISRGEKRPNHSGLIIE